MKKEYVFTALVRTESGDRYVFVFKKKPKEDDVIKMVWEAESAADLEFYMDTTGVEIKKTEVL